MAEFEAAVLKLRKGATVGLGRITGALDADDVGQQQEFSVNDFDRLLDVGLPDGGAM